MQKIIYIIIFTLLTSFVLSTNTFADSDYGVLLTDYVKLGGTSTLGTCSDVDLTTSWSQIMREYNPSDNEYSYQNTWNYQTNYNNARTDLTNFADSYNTVLAQGKGWAVAQLAMTEDITTSNPDWNAYHKMIRIYTFDPSTVWTQYDGYLSASSNVKYTDYFLNPNQGCRYQAWTTNGTTSFIAFTYAKIFLLNGNINYLPDYNGQPIPSTYTPPSPLNAGYTIDSNSLLKANFDQSNDITQAKYQLYDSTDTLIDEKIYNFQVSYVYQLTQNETYKLKISPEPLSNPQNLQPVIFTFTPNGAMQTQSTATSTCDSNGVCTPNPNETTPFSDVKIETHGLLGIITAPVALYQYIQNASDDNCTPLHINLIYQITQASPSSNPSALASPEPLTLPCMSSFYKSTIDKSDIYGYPNFFQIYQTITFGVVAYYVGLQLLRIVKNAKDPKHDKIETTEL